MINMMNFLKKMKEDSDIFKDVFCGRMKDISIPLNERWEEFCYAVNNGLYDNLKGYLWHSQVTKKELGKELYDIGYYNRYQDYDFPSIIEGIEEEIDCDEDYEYTPEIVDKLKEEMLQSGYSGFCFDW